MSSAGLAAGRARRNGAGNRCALCIAVYARKYEPLLYRMRALLDGIFESEEGFQEAENDDEFEYKGGELLAALDNAAYFVLNPTLRWG